MDAEIDVGNAGTFQVRFPAMAGVQAGRTYYVAMVPMRFIPRLLRNGSQAVSPKERHQRLLNKARVPRIARYLTDNLNAYVFSGLVAVLNGDYDFRPIPGADRIGVLTVPMETELNVLDGQHRVAAIQRALADHPELGDDSLPVQVFVAAGVKRAQQFFADLNGHGVRPSRSISLLYDHREPLAALTCELVERTPLLRDLTDFEHTSVPRTGKNLFTLSALGRSVSALLGGLACRNVEDDAAAFLFDYWERLCAVIEEWGDAWQGRITCRELRESSVIAHGVAHHALGHVGRDLLGCSRTMRRRVLKQLRGAKWARSAWEGRASSGGRMMHTPQSVVLTANGIRHILGLPLVGDAKLLEDRFRRGGAAGSRRGHRKTGNGRQRESR